MDSEYSEEFLEYIEKYIEDLGLNISQAEKTGATFLSIGYFLFIIASNNDILEILNPQYSNIHSIDIFIYGEELIIIGYFLLWLVSIKRLEEFKLKVKYRNLDFCLNVQKQLINLYFISVITNYLRLKCLEYFKQNSIIFD